MLSLAGADPIGDEALELGGVAVRGTKASLVEAAGAGLAYYQVE